MTDQPGGEQGSVHTLADAARLTGLSVDALRQRIKRGKLEQVTGNDGLVRVRLPMASLNAKRLDADVQADRTLSDQVDDKDQTIKVLQDHLTSLREQVVAKDAEILGLRDRVGRLEEERDIVRIEREDARIAAARAEGEATALREALAEARRPPWRRWLGWP